MHWRSPPAPFASSNPAKACGHSFESHEADGEITGTVLQPVIGTLKLPLRTSHVLWVDNDPSGNFFERRGMRRWNVCFTKVLSTQEAVRALEDSPGKYALVISDWSRPKVPGDGGPATAAALKGIPTKPALIFYVSRGRAAIESNREEAKELGAIDQTGNPFVLFSESLDALARHRGIESLDAQAIGDRSWLPAFFATGLSWLQRLFLTCSAD